MNATIFKTLPLAALAVSASAGNSAKGKPNIVIILADDVG
jgi:hypothetical protein